HLNLALCLVDQLWLRIVRSIEEDRAAPGRATGDDQRRERRPRPAAAAFASVGGEVLAARRVRGTKAGGLTGFRVLGVELQRQDRRVTRAAVGDRDGHREHLVAACLERTVFVVGVARIGDGVGDIDREFGLLERRLPQAVGREDERDRRDDGGDGLAASWVRRTARDLVRAFTRLRAGLVSPQPRHTLSPAQARSPARQWSCGNWARVRRTSCARRVMAGWYSRGQATMDSRALSVVVLAQAGTL